MIEYEVVPHIGVGPVRLGMTHDEVIKAMGRQPDIVNGKITVGCYHRCAFQVDYSTGQHIAEYIEISDWPDFIARFDGIDVFHTPAKELVAHIASKTPYDDTDWELGYSYIFREYDLGLWRPVIPESDEDPDGRYFSTIGVGIKDYYQPRTPSDH